MMIKLRNFTFGYDETNPLFKDCDLEIRKDEICVLTGANGSGKTTFCRIVCGFERNYTGEISIAGREHKNMQTYEIAEKIIYLKQEPKSNIIAATANEDLMIWQTAFTVKDDENYKKNRLNALKYFNLSEFYDSPVWELSFGQMKSLGLLASILKPKRFLLCDEPLSGLDNERITKFLEILNGIKTRNSGALIISHRPEIFRDIADKFFNIKNKKIEEMKI